MNATFLTIADAREYLANMGFAFNRHCTSPDGRRRPSGESWMKGKRVALIRRRPYQPLTVTIR